MCVCVIAAHADRGGKNSVNRLLFQRVAEWEHSLDDSVESNRRRLQVGPIVCECALHDIHGVFHDSLLETVNLSGVEVRELSKCV